MNLKKTVLSTFAAFAVAGSVLAPLASADDTRQASTTVNEGGSFSYQFSGGQSFAFEDATVTTLQGQTLNSSPDGKVKYFNVTVEDTHSTSNGWAMYLSATELRHGTTNYTILPENLSVEFRQFASQGCVYTYEGGPAALQGGNPSQAYQTVTPVTGIQTLEDTIPLVSAGEGRGCGTVIPGWWRSLYVPKGTYTGGEGEGAQYVGTVTLTNSADVGDPQVD